jgi:mTERF domain-containing protein, mitochondrial
VALQASKHIDHLKSTDRPDAVLRFLREIAIDESDIRTAVSKDSRLLRSGVETIWKPNIQKLQEVGYSREQISGIIASCPSIFRSNFVTKIDFWLGVLGSVKNLSVVLRRSPSILHYSLKNAVIPKLSFLRDQCGLSSDQIAQLIKRTPRLITSTIENLKRGLERVEQLGIPCSSRTFVYALAVVSERTQDVIDARLNNLRSLGFSQEEVAFMISKSPSLLGLSEELVCRKMDFLIKEAGCSKDEVVQYPYFLAYSLENRLIPRSIVRKLLMSKDIPVARQKIATFTAISEEQFLKKFVLPFEHAIPGLHRAYADAGKIEGID